MEEIYKANGTIEVKLTRRDLARMLNGEIIELNKVRVGMVEE